MCRTCACVLVWSTFLGLLTQNAHAGDPDKNAQRQALALQRLIQKTIQNVEPSVVSIVVSRSGDFRRFGLTSPGERTGRLGGYDAALLDRRLRGLGLSAEIRRRTIKRLDLANPDNIPESTGSGVILAESGLVLTHYQVVKGASKIYVRWADDRGGYADIYAAEPRSNMAVLRLLDSAKLPHPIKLGNGGAVRRGQFALALSYPFAPEFRDGQRTASWGIISNIRRRSHHQFENESDAWPLGPLLQTDTRIHGECGGVLVNLKGEMVGLTTNGLPTRGPKNRAESAVALTPGLQRIISVLSKGHEVEYGFLGVRAAPVVNGVIGVPISHVTPGSPADQCGLRARDRICAIDGRKVKSGNDLFSVLGTLMADAKVRLNFVRPVSVSNEDVTVQLAKCHVPGEAFYHHTNRPFFRGLRVDHASLLVQGKFPELRCKHIPCGVLISEVKPNSPAASQQLRPGEVITHVNDIMVHTPYEFYNFVREIRGPIELSIRSAVSGKSAAKVKLKV